MTARVSTVRPAAQGTQVQVTDPVGPPWIKYTPSRSALGALMASTHACRSDLSFFISCGPNRVQKRTHYCTTPRGHLGSCCLDQANGGLDLFCAPVSLRERGCCEPLPRLGEGWSGCWAPDPRVRVVAVHGDGSLWQDRCQRLLMGGVPCATSLCRCLTDHHQFL